MRWIKKSIFFIVKRSKMKDCSKIYDFSTDLPSFIFAKSLKNLRKIISRKQIINDVITVIK